MKAVSFFVGGVSVLPEGSDGSDQADFAPTKMTAELTKQGIFVHAEKVGLMGGFKEQKFLEFPLKGSTFTKLDEDRDMSRTAIGAVAGGLLLGPLGLAAGGALGSAKRSIYEIRRGEDLLLLEISPSEKKMSVFTSNGPQIFMRIPPLVPCFA